MKDLTSVPDAEGSRAFQRILKENLPDLQPQRWNLVLHDQLSQEIGVLKNADPRQEGVIFFESDWYLHRRPWHRQKLVLLLANQRHFALELARSGFRVRYLRLSGSFSDGVKRLLGETGTFQLTRPAEREVFADLKSCYDSLEIRDHDGWLTTLEDFRESQKQEPPWRMDAFYRYVRRKSGILMEEGSPAGGKFSFDPENRETWSGEPAAPEPPCFEADEVTAEVGDLIDRTCRRHPGRLRLEAIPASRADALKLWDWAKTHCLKHFGPYEDAMSVRSDSLFHTRISPLLNIHRLLPGRVIREAVDMQIPLQSKEGFVRQVLGWREFMYHVHTVTDGFRDLPGQTVELSPEPGDGGYASWTGRSWEVPVGGPKLKGEASPSRLGSREPLPPAYWGRTSGLKCLDHVVATVWNDAYSHHITRLMILCNIATLLDVEPRELTDWFWIAYLDAYDWVVEPNVLGMGTFALLDLFTTKPYVSGAPYIRRMSDYCESCTFDPEKNCPITRLYWAFLDRHLPQLGDNPRLRLILGNLRRRRQDEKKRDRQTFDLVRSKLAQGESVAPEELSFGESHE